MYRIHAPTARAQVPVRTALEALENRTLFAAGDLDPSFGRTESCSPKTLPAASAPSTCRRTGRSSPSAARRRATVSTSARRSYVTTPTARSTRSFGGGDGVVLFDRFGGFSLLTDVEILPNGDVVAAGTALEERPEGFTRAYVIAARLNAAGAGVGSFGDGGLAAVGGVPHTGGLITYLRPRVALDALPSGEVFVAGQTVVGTPGESNGRVLVAGDVGVRRQAFVTRLTPGGAEDTSFGGGDGVVWLDYSRKGLNTWHVTGNALALQGDGKIVLAGSVSFIEDRGGFRVTRLNLDGSIDARFGAGGTRPFGFPGVGGMPTEVKIQPDGKIVAGGMSTRFSRRGFVIGRIEPHGDMDPTFGERGRVFTPHRIGNLNHVDVHNPVDMDLRADGKIVMVGNFPVFGDIYDFDQTPLLARYLNDQPEPPPPGGESWTVQGEDAERPLDETTIRSTHAGYTGSGYVDYDNASGDSIE